MASINFYLRPGQKNKSGEQSLQMRITYNGKRAVFFLNCMVNPKHWSAKKQFVKPPNQREPDNNHVFINERIRIFRNKAEEAINHATKKSIPLSNAYFKNWLSEKNHGSGMDSKGFFEWFGEYINTGRSEKAERTIKGYVTVRNFLKEFEKDTGYAIDLSNIDMAFFDQLKNYAFLTREVQDNYFLKILNVLKSFLNWSKERGAPVSDTYRKFNSPEREKDIIFLTIDELMRLYNYKFKSERLNKARDIYCFGCFTGLRISDILKLRKEQIKEDRIEKVISKTRIKNSIPLNKYSRKILDKYSDLETPLPKISVQKLNCYIKECCKETGINSEETITIFSGGKVYEKTVPKYELITSHTARKTFITNSIILGMNQMTARAISGHKKDKNFNRYLKIAEDFKQREMEKTWDSINLTPN